MVDVMENDYANVHRGVYALSQRATDKFEAARGKAAKFINAPHEDSIIFSRGATEGINLVAASYGQRLGAGDEIITTELEHHSNIVPWQIIAEKQGAKVCSHLWMTMARSIWMRSARSSATARKSSR